MAGKTADRDTLEASLRLLKARPRPEEQKSRELAVAEFSEDQVVRQTLAVYRELGAGLAQ